jgi:hypothetical protein
MIIPAAPREFNFRIYILLKVFYKVLKILGGTYTYG